MASTISRIIFNASTNIFKNNISNLRSLHTATTSYAARKGTREKARAKKIKVEITKVGFIPHNKRGKTKKRSSKIDLHNLENKKTAAVDNVYSTITYLIPTFSTEEAINCHKQTHHPTMYNAPEALVIARVELNLEAVKKNRYLENFGRLSLLPHNFPRDEQRTVLAFCKTPELQKESMEAGATLAGGTEIVKKIQDGEVKLAEFDIILAHPDIVTDLVPIRGLLKRKFPNLRSNTLDANIVELVKKFASGIQYKAQKDDIQKNFGFVEVPVGKLNMETQKIAENIETIIKDIDKARPKREGLFITSCYLLSPPSLEKIKIDPFQYVEATLNLESVDSDDEDETVTAQN